MNAADAVLNLETSLKLANAVTFSTSPGDFWQRSAMARLIVLYAVALALAVAGLEWLEYRYVTRAFSTQIYIVLLAAGFAGLGLWEVYLAMTDYAFMDQYIAGVMRARQAQGVPAAAMAEEIAKLESLRANYANPLFRLPMTFLEIFPVGLLVSLVSALLLRDPGSYLPYESCHFHHLYGGVCG